jgi:hypothetical protein
MHSSGCTEPASCGSSQTAGGQFVFAPETITDTQTGLVWTREWNLVSGEYGIDFGRLSGFTAELNARRYGGRSDWRIPTYEELRTLMDAVAKNPFRSEGFVDEKLAQALNDLGFIGVKDRPYWVTMKDKDGAPCAVYFFNRLTVCSTMPYNYQFIPVANAAGTLSRQLPKKQNR